jgi:hypothetical protein
VKLTTSVSSFVERTIMINYAAVKERLVPQFTTLKIRPKWAVKKFVPMNRKKLYRRIIVDIL